MCVCVCVFVHVKRFLGNYFGGVFLLLYFVHFVVPMGISPMGNWGRVPQGKLAAAVSRYPTLINYKVHARSFRVSIIHRTLKWTSATCVRDHSYAYVYTREGGLHRQLVSTIFLTQKTLTNLSCAPNADGVRTSCLSISSSTFYQLSHTVTPIKVIVIKLGTVTAASYMRIHAVLIILTLTLIPSHIS